MTVTVVAHTTLNPGAEADLKQYLAVVMPLMEAAGARVLSRHEHVEWVTGENLPQFVTIVEYPDRAAVRQVFEHPDFLAVAALHRRVFKRYDASIMEQTQLTAPPAKS